MLLGRGDPAQQRPDQGHVAAPDPLRDRLVAALLVDRLCRSAWVHREPDVPPPVRSPGPGDDLVASAHDARAVLVSRDAHLLGLGDEIPVHASVAFLDLLAKRPWPGRVRPELTPWPGRSSALRRG